MNQPDALVRREVDSEAALAAVERLIDLALAGDHRRAPARLLTLERFDLDDVRAEVRQRHAGDRTGDDLRELEHANAREGAVLRGDHGVPDRVELVVGGA
jgi:hypothetical protein